MFQSTHPRGVRQDLQKTKRLRKSFNPRTREGCDLDFLTGVIASMKFQSTHPRGVRQQVEKQGRRDSSFNPRTREGCDQNLTLLQSFPR